MLLVRRRSTQDRATPTQFSVDQGDRQIVFGLLESAYWNMTNAAIAGTDARIACSSCETIDYCSDSVKLLER